MLGKLVSAGELGVYSIALLLSQFTLQGVRMIAANVLFPLYARMRDEGGTALRASILKSRQLVLSLALPPLWAMALLGPEIVEWLYDPRYHEAGWMLQILAIGMLGPVVSVTQERILMAHGDSKRHMLLQAISAGLLFAGLVAGGLVDGVRGIIAGMSVARLLGYLPLVLLIRRYDAWMPRQDALVFGVSALVLGVGFGIRSAL